MPNNSPRSGGPYASIVNLIGGAATLSTALMSPRTQRRNDFQTRRTPTRLPSTVIAGAAKPTVAKNPCGVLRLNSRAIGLSRIADVRAQNQILILPRFLSMQRHAEFAIHDLHRRQSASHVRNENFIGCNRRVRSIWRGLPPATRKRLALGNCQCRKPPAKLSKCGHRVPSFVGFGMGRLGALSPLIPAKSRIARASATRNRIG